MIKVVSSALVFGLIYFSSIILHATIIHVPDDQPTIQAGIDAAIESDTVLVADGTYTGVGNRDIEFKGKAILVISANGAKNSTIDCQADSTNTHRAFEFTSFEDNNSILDGFTIVNGYGPYVNSTYCGSGNAGGAIYCRRSTPIIRNCYFENNTAGGVSYGNLGAAIFCDGSVSFEDSTKIINCVFVNNTGNAVFTCDHARTLLLNCEFRNNSKSGASANLGRVIIINSGFFNNGSSAAYNLLFARSEIYNCFFYGNSKAYGCADGCSGYLENCTIVNNNSGVRAYYQSDLELHGCIIAYSTAGQAVSVNTEPGIESEAVLNCCNLFGNFGGDWTDEIIDQYGINGNFTEEPMFCDTSNTNFHLLFDSPCAPLNNTCQVIIGAFPVGCEVICGDINGDGLINILDITYLINALYMGGPECNPAEYSDVNSDGIINILDITYLITYLYLGGPEPVCP